MASPISRARMDELIEEFDLTRLRRRKAGVLSSGEQTRLTLAKAMLNRPRLLLLDEPTASVDPSGARDIRAPHRRFVDSGHGGVLWTSHNMHGGRSGVRPRAVPVAWPHRARGRSENPAGRSMARATLEDLFVAVAKETLHAGAAR